MNAISTNDIEVNIRVFLSDFILKEAEKLSYLSGVKFRILIIRIIKAAYSRYIKQQNSSTSVVYFNTTIFFTNKDGTNEKQEKNIRLDADSYELLKEMASTAQMPIKYMLELIINHDIPAYLEYIEKKYEEFKQLENDFNYNY